MYYFVTLPSAVEKREILEERFGTAEYSTN
jgi:hypothetical protein